MQEQKEVWKDVPGYEGLYQVSNLGNVKSLPRFILNRITKEKISKGILYNRGYYIFSLSKNKNRKKILVHQLVAMAFLGHKPSKYKKIIDHINNNKLDNRVENLQIISPRLNCTKDRKRKNNLIGCYFNKEKKLWQSQIFYNKKHYFLGRFNTEKEASEMYFKALSNIDNISKFQTFLQFKIFLNNL